MRAPFSIRSLAFLVIAIAVVGWSSDQSPQQSSRTPSNGVKCPAEFQAIWDAGTKVLRCRKDVVSWVVTGCSDKAFNNYLVKPGPDSCGPTQIAGVGTPPGVRGAKAVSCAAEGYELMTDRTGERDRCERIERIFALPLPVS
jgi:hypothetical protein